MAVIALPDGVTPGILHEVDVPIMTNTECHNMFKKAGHVKRILDSFICAGYPEGKKDSCEVCNTCNLLLLQLKLNHQLVSTRQLTAD